MAKPRRVHPPNPNVPHDPTLSDKHCCTKHLKIGIKILADMNQPQAYWSQATHNSRGRNTKPLSWCEYCWYDRIRLSWHQTFVRRRMESKIRALAWEKRAFMSKEERRRTPLPPEIPYTYYSHGKYHGRPRLARHYNWIYAQMRNRKLGRLYKESKVEIKRAAPKTRHVVNPC